MKSKEIKYKLHKSFIYIYEEEDFADDLKSKVEYSTLGYLYRYDALKITDEDFADDLKSKVYIVNGNCFTILPCKVEWCDTCNGSGHRSRYDVGGYDISSMMYDENGIIDEGFHEDYFSGRTDIECDACGGTKINNIIDYDSLTPQQEKILSINDRCINEEAYSESEY